MRISRVIIQNWRSVKDADFAPSDMTVLVGANNAGKTNILSAINFLLGDRWPMPGNLLDSDYFLGDRSRDIFIQLDFENAPYQRIDFDTSRERYTLKAYDGRGYEFRGFNNEERARLAFAYVDASRNFDRQFGVSRWTLFGQAVRLLHDDLLQADNTRLPDLRGLLDQAHELLKTDLYNSFETALRDAFAEQLRTSRYDVQFQFRTIDETNLYRSLYPTLVERGQFKSPSEAGSGVRNLLVLALFHAFARAFRGGAILGIEEPELFLHPHAQRSLMGQFEVLVSEGNQLFVSSHSSAFLDITRPERVVLVECKEDEEGEYCTHVRTTSAEALLEKRQQLHPERAITLPSMRAFMRNIRKAEMAEPYFAKLVVIAEGPSEREALPLLCSHLGLHFDEEGISIIAAGGKTAIDTLVHVYQSHGIPVYVVFDNDHGRSSERNANKVMCRLLGIPETEAPTATITSSYAILDENWETQMRTDLDAVQPGLYVQLVGEAQRCLRIESGRNKPLVARFVAEQLAHREITPLFVQQIVAHLRIMLGLASATEVHSVEENSTSPWDTQSAEEYSVEEDELPF
jgi:putative ATP-dependent endonuclease of OLD family